MIKLLLSERILLISAASDKVLYSKRWKNPIQTGLKDTGYFLADEIEKSRCRVAFRQA